jgi:penicillin amidase
LAQAYVDGVNAGLLSLRTRPWPYLLLRKQPAPWRLEDSALTGYAMYFDLQDADNTRELALWKLRPHMPSTLYALLARDGTTWDAPLIGTPRGDAILPDASAVDLRKLPMPEGGKRPDVPQPSDVGSNNFAVSGELTRDGRAIIADDMHLGLRTPNIWFRARLRYPDARAVNGRVDATGSPCPPSVAGRGQQRPDRLGVHQQLWRLARLAAEPACAAPCAGHRRFEEHIRVAGQDDTILRLKRRNGARSCIATKTAAPWPCAGWRTCRFADAGIERFPACAFTRRRAADGDRTAIPGQNLVIGDRSGRITWRLLDRRHCVRLPATRPPSCRRAHARRGRSRPLPHRPASSSLQRLWTANARVVDGDLLARIGDGGYANGARARQIRDDLFARKDADRTRPSGDPARRPRVVPGALVAPAARTGHEGNLARIARSWREAAATWQGRASTDSSSYRIVRAWRLAVHDRLLDGLTAPARAEMGEDFAMPGVGQFEGVPGRW